MPLLRESRGPVRAAVVTVVLAVAGWPALVGCTSTDHPSADPTISTHYVPGPDDENEVPPARAVVVGIRTDGTSGVLTDATGFTLYTFSADGPLSPRCTGACALRWRPAYSSGGKPQAGNGAFPADVGSVRRDDGSYQVTFRGAPLYYFTGDSKPGDHNGSGRSEFGGRWSCSPPAGQATH